MNDGPPAGAITRHLRITGRVHGWVRNRPDGSVEAVVHGLHAPVQSLIAWAQHGPAPAKVEGVAVTVMVGEAVPCGFEQRAT